MCVHLFFLELSLVVASGNIPVKLYCSTLVQEEALSNLLLLYPIGGVMISVLASIAVDRGLELLSGKTKDFKISICCFSAKHAALGERAKTGRLGIRIMCPNTATFLTADCCFNELAL